MGGRTPGSKLPASPPPLLRPDGGGQPWPCTCVHGPKNYVEASTCCTTTGMSPSLSKNCFCTSGPEHSLAQQRACPHPCPRRLDLWNTVKMSCSCGTSTHQDQGNCRFTQRARQPRPRAALVESPRELQRAATVETRPSSPRRHPKNMLILHNRDVEHFVNGLQLDNLYGQLNRQTKGAVSAPRQK